jgi:Icc-related predicted phosphoesterase
MKILAIADVETEELKQSSMPARFSAVDLILACGDLQPEYLTLVRQRMNAPLYYVHGNHDLRHRQSPPDGCTDLGLQTVREQSIKLVGLPGSRWYNGGIHQYHATEMRMLVWKLYFAVWRQQGVDIVISHAPLRHINDCEDRCHRGFKCFHNLLNRFHPSYFLHGHIHAHFADDRDRITRLNTTKIINCCGAYVFEDNFI